MKKLHLRIWRGAPGRPGGFGSFTVELAEDANILDGVQAVFGAQDKTLLYRHACHHASCGLCGARVNGRERLMCITPVSEFADGDTVTLEPLRNLPWVGDLVVDITKLMRAMGEISFSYVRDDELTDGQGDATRFEDCLECGLCLSACPFVGTDPMYAGPGPLAAIARLLQEPRGRDEEHLCRRAGGDHGVWRCHSVMECNEVCPSYVEPSTAIGWLRRRLLFGKGR